MHTSNAGQVDPEPAHLSAACPANTMMDVMLSSSATQEGGQAPARHLRKPIAALAATKGPVVPDSPQQAGASPWMHTRTEHGDNACGAVRSTTPPGAVSSPQRDSDGVGTAPLQGPLQGSHRSHGVLCGEESSIGCDGKELHGEALSPSMIRKSGLKADLQEAPTCLPQTTCEPHVNRALHPFLIRNSLASARHARMNHASDLA